MEWQEYGGFICIREVDGSIHGAFMNQNASIDNAGTVLANFYTDINKVRKLIAMKSIDSVRLEVPDEYIMNSIIQETESGRWKFGIRLLGVDYSNPNITSDNISIINEHEKDTYYMYRCNGLGYSRRGSNYEPLKNEYIYEALRKPEFRAPYIYIFNVQDGFWYIPFGGQQHRLLATEKGAAEVLKGYNYYVTDMKAIENILNKNRICDIKSANLWLKRKCPLTRKYRLKTRKKGNSIIYNIEGDVGGTWNKIAELNVNSPREAVDFIAGKLGVV